ncbi:unnamed protein product [Ciceribacter sp. T2.26MG-112.2]|nr:unnamed protein product [Ciceribacter naphthalenivorans]
MFSTPRHIRRTADISQSHVRPTGGFLQRRACGRDRMQVIRDRKG